MSNNKTLITKAIEAAFSEASAKGQTAEAARKLFAGVSAAKREDVRKAWYDGIRAKAGLVDGKLIPARKLEGETALAYDCARKAFSKLYPSTRTSGKRTVRAGKVTVTKAGGTAKAQLAKTARSPKSLASTLKILVANLQADEKPKFKDQPRLIAALQAALTLAV